jgi:hypothetical protein
LRCVINLPAADATDARDRFYQFSHSLKQDIDRKAFKVLYTDESGVKRKIKLISVEHLASNFNPAQ